VARARVIVDLLAGPDEGIVALGECLHREVRLFELEESGDAHLDDGGFEEDRCADAVGFRNLGVFFDESSQDSADLEAGHARGFGIDDNGVSPALHEYLVKLFAEFPGMFFGIVSVHVDNQNRKMGRVETDIGHLVFSLLLRCCVPGGSFPLGTRYSMLPFMDRLDSLQN